MTESGIGMLHYIYKTFLRGLAFLVPIAATLFLIAWLGRTAESGLGSVLRTVLPSDWYVPGTGLALGFILVFTAGLLLRLWLFRKLQERVEGLLRRIPLVNSLFGALKDMFGLLAEKETKKGMQVVLVSLPDSSLKLVGLLTREDLSGLPDQLGDSERVAVYLQMSYQIGGYTVLVPRSMIEPVDMPVEDALRFVLTAGVSTETLAVRDTATAGDTG